VGLGNPDQEYAGTYHNVGHMANDELLNQWDYECHAVNQGTVYLMKEGPLQFIGQPDCYVNQTGSVVKKWLDVLDLSPGQLLIVYDDFALDLGQVRLRPEGSAGGHRGLQSIIDRCGTERIPRLRIGIGPLPESTDPADFVLSRVVEGDRECLRNVLKTMPEILESVVNDDFDSAMSQWNGVEFCASR